MQKHRITITARDRLLRAWQNTTELVRDFGAYAEEEGRDSELGRLYAECAVDEGVHAARFLEMLHGLERQDP
jgi:rubrerythrin